MKKTSLFALPFLVGSVVSASAATTAFTPSTLSQFGDPPGPTIDGGGLITMTQAVNGQSNAVGFNVSDAGIQTGSNFSFGFKITPGVGTADGFSIGWGNTANIGTSGASPNLGEEGNFAGGLAFSFDTWNNSGLDPGPDGGDLSQISLHYNGVKIGTVDDTRLLVGGFPIDDGNLHTATGFADFAGGTVSLSVDGVPIYTNFAVAGLAPMESRIVISARTGGENELLEISNLNFAFVPEPGVALLSLVGAVGLLRRRR